MLHKFTLPILAALMLAGSGVAYAATTGATGDAGDHGNATHMRYQYYARCQDLANTFDMRVGDHPDAQHLARAKELRDEGMQECSQDNYLYGVHTLEQALLDIGVTPPMANYF